MSMERRRRLIGVAQWVLIGLACVLLLVAALSGVGAAGLIAGAAGAACALVGFTLPLVLWRCPWCRRLLPVGRGVTAVRTDSCPTCSRAL